MNFSIFYAIDKKSIFFHSKIYRKKSRIFLPKTFENVVLLLSKKRYQIYLHSMNTQRATNKNVPTANYFETDFSVFVVSHFESQVPISPLCTGLVDFSLMFFLIRHILHSLRFLNSCF